MDLLTVQMTSWTASHAQVVQVAAGGMHSVALSADGEVYTTGVNDEGALGRETGKPSYHFLLWQHAKAALHAAESTA